MTLTMNDEAALMPMPTNININISSELPSSGNGDEHDAERVNNSKVGSRSTPPSAAAVEAEIIELLLPSPNQTKNKNVNVTVTVGDNQEKDDNNSNDLNWRQKIELDEFIGNMVEHDHENDHQNPAAAAIAGGNNISIRDPLTLNQWLENCPYDLVHRLRVASAIAEALSGYHATTAADAYADGDVAHQQEHENLKGASSPHEKISTSNILILDNTLSDEHNFITATDTDAATLIDIELLRSSSARHLSQNDKLEDLKGLGHVFCELFQENHNASNNANGSDVEREILRMMNNNNENKTDDDDDDDDRRLQPSSRRKKRVKPKDAVDGLPLYISSLISALIGAANGGSDNCCDTNANVDDVPRGRYTDVRHVVSDLNTAVRKHDIFFRMGIQNADAVTFTELKGDLPVCFYGRQSELETLMYSFDSVMTPPGPGSGGQQQGQSMMVAVSGAGGMGKTTLVNQLIKPLKERHGYLISGKFDLMAGKDAVIFSAIDSFFETLMKEGGDDTSYEHDLLKLQLRKRITDVVGGFGVNVLTKSIPNLGNFVENTLQANPFMICDDHQGTVLQTRQVLLCKLISAIADKNTPVVVVLDDLQWADESSLDVLRMIATDPDITYCLCIGCYRDDDCGLTQKVTNMFKGVRNHTNVTSINLAPLEKESVNTLISEIFCFPPSLAEQLSSVVFNKTAGAPMYVLNFLQSLCEEDLIRFNLTDRRWEYQIKGIRLKELPEGVVRYMTSQMEKLPYGHRLVLKVAACLGHSFDYGTFKKAKVTKKHNLEDILPRVASLGFIQELENNRYVWAHDQVMQAGYGLIPLDRREAFHLLIGMKLFMGSPIGEVEKSIFVIVAQISMGKRLLESDAQKCEVAELMLLAGETALSTSSFSSAASYFKSGIELLRHDCWETRYKLSLKLHDAALESCYAIGDFTTLRTLTSEILAHARNFDDKLNCYHNLVRYLASSRQSEECIKTCIHVLDELGETEGISLGLGISMKLSVCNLLHATLPTQLSDAIAYGHYKSVKRKLSQYEEEDILSLPPMVNERKLVAMEFLNHMISSCNNTRPHLNAFIICRMVILTLEYGLCDASACAFSGFGNMNGVDQDFDEGKRWGHVALKVMERLGERNRFVARVFTNVYGFINVWKNPFQASLPKLLEGYNAGCLHGDVEYSYWQLQIYCGLSLNSGEDLTKLQHDATKYAQRAMQHKQSTVANGIVTILSAVVELTGERSRDGAFEAVLNCTEDTLYQQLASSNEERACTLICNKGKFVSILMGDIEGAIRYYHMGLRHPFGSRMTSINIIMEAFTNGILAFMCAQRPERNDQGQWLNIGIAAIKQMKKWMISSQWNFESKVYLMEAEAMLLRGNYEFAQEKYEASIKAARRSRFVHEEGFAFERFGNFYLGRGRETDAILQFTQAKSCYKRWGALALVRQMESRIDCIWGDLS